MPPGTGLEASVLKEDRMKQYWMYTKQVFQLIKDNPKKFFKIYLMIFQVILFSIAVVYGIIAMLIMFGVLFKSMH